MPYLKDIALGSLTSGGDTQKQLEGVVKQLNDWAREISNERRSDIYKDNAGTNRIIIGVLPDNETGIVMSKEGVDVTSVFE